MDGGNNVMSIAKFHAEWLSLIEISGPFLSLPVLKKVFPQGLDAHDSDHFRMLRQVHEEWDDNQQGLKPDPAIHTQWIKWVLRNTLELEEVLVEGQDIPQTLKAEIEEPQHRETLRPDMVVMGPDNKARMLIQWYPLKQKLGRTVEGKPWKASPDTRMTQLLRDSGVPLGLITNGDQWMVVYAPQGETSGYASWYSTLWLEEQKTLAAFRTLLSLHRFFGVPDDETLVPMLAESASTQQEVTDQLGSQVRSAVEILIQSLDRADQDYGRELLADVPEEVLYEAALTVMMRLVFLFCAEERELLLLGDQLFDQHYAVSTLVAQLQNTADQHGEEILERRLDAWCRLLSTFRAVYGGVNHDRMHLPAYSGNLFDPDRFPFLEGRKSDTSWKDTEANPLPINNRTVLHLLRSLQYLEMHGEAQRLSFRALDIEQIGHVYEGLLDHTAKRSTEPVLGLVGKHEPETALAQLEEQRAKGNDDFFDFLKKETGSGRKWENYLDQELNPEASNRLRSACGNDEELFERVLPYAKLVRNDTFDRPVVIGKNSFFVTAGTDRRSSGTHYTPRSLTEPIVKHTLEPLVYEGPAEGKPREEWKLKSPKELLDLKICDMACGSGAFLVQATRYMAERLLEAWEAVEKESPNKAKITPFGEPSTGEADEQLIPDDSHERVVYARRIIAQRCLYGVDLNPLATDMAKLGLWLLTLAKDKPFTFLDHSIRSGDSLVGISSIDQLENFSMNGTGSQRSFAHQQIARRIDAARSLRQQLERMPSNSVEDIERKKEMLKRAEEQTGRLRYAADMLLAVFWKPMADSQRQDELRDTLIDVEFKFKDLPVSQLEAEAASQLTGISCKGRFHWPMEFPEVFDGTGMSVFIGNPPFRPGRFLSGDFGDNYLAYLQTPPLHHQGQADLCSAFARRAFTLLEPTGVLGMIVTKTISEGDTRDAFLVPSLSDGGELVWVRKIVWWPGDAQVVVSLMVVARQPSDIQKRLDGRSEESIDATFSATSQPGVTPFELAGSKRLVGKGVGLGGKAYKIAPDALPALRELDPIHVRRFVRGTVHNSAIDEWGGEGVFWFEDIESEEELRALEVGKAFIEQVEDTTKSNYWKYRRNGEKHHRHLRSTDCCIIRAQTSSTWFFSFASTDDVFDQSIISFGANCAGLWCILTSNVHFAWVAKYGRLMKTDTAYAASDFFYNFPLPYDPITDSDAELASLARESYRTRKSYCENQRIGMTDLFGRMNDPECEEEDAVGLRDAQVKIDSSVMRSYQFTDVDLEHDFRDTIQGVRYTISETARREVLYRLLELNHRRYKEEVEQAKPSKGKEKSKAAPKRKKKAPAQAATLFPHED